MALEKIELPEWAGDDWSSKGNEDPEALVIKAIKKINEIVEELNK